MMQESTNILLCMTELIVSTVAIIGGAYWGVRFLMSNPKHLQWHLLTAIIWTSTLAIVTAMIMIYTENWFSTYFMWLVAGMAFIPSWRQLLERRRGEVAGQKRRPSFVRLCSQTLLGPVLMFSVAGAIAYNGQAGFEQAVANRDLKTAFVLRDLKLGDPVALQGALYGAVDRQDEEGVRTYLKIGVPVNDDDDYGDSSIRRAIEFRDTTISSLLLDHIKSADYTSLLQYAVDRDQVEQARLLLQYGANRKTPNYEGLTPFQVAKHHKNKEMVALLLQPVR